MKKLAFLIAIAFVFSLSTPLMAASTFTHNAVPEGDIATDASQMIVAYRTSTNVVLVADGDNAAYEVVAGHNQGNRMFSSGSGLAQLFWADKVVGDTIAAGDLPGAELEPDPDTGEVPESATWKPL